VCVLCGDRGAPQLDLCPDCRRTLPALEHACVQCAEPLPPGTATLCCGRCQQQPPAYTQTLAPFIYEPPLDHLVQRLKFDGRLELARILGELLAAWLAERSEQRPDALVPVPLHDARLRERGFNQSHEIARIVSRRLQVPLSAHACVRVRETPPQSGLSRRQRRKNLRGAFEVRGRVAGHVAIVDDVMTTGSTAQALAQALLAAGAARVDVWVCARA
jgi:ComF family protein